MIKRELHVPATRIGEIVHERRRIIAETALWMWMKSS